MFSFIMQDRMRSILDTPTATHINLMDVVLPKAFLHHHCCPECPKWKEFVYNFQDVNFNSKWAKAGIKIKVRQSQFYKVHVHQGISSVGVI